VRSLRRRARSGAGGLLDVWAIVVVGGITLALTIGISALRLSEPDQTSELLAGVGVHSSVMVAGTLGMFQMLVVVIAAVVAAKTALQPITKRLQ
jgi:hypothetical protein